MRKSFLRRFAPRCILETRYFHDFAKRNRENNVSLRRIFRRRRRQTCSTDTDFKGIAINRLSKNFIFERGFQLDAAK
jgi:hypothetical protein